jgi:hypothetical protein
LLCITDEKEEKNNMKKITLAVLALIVTQLSSLAANAGTCTAPSGFCFDGTGYSPDMSVQDISGLFIASVSDRIYSVDDSSQTTMKMITASRELNIMSNGISMNLGTLSSDYGLTLNAGVSITTAVTRTGYTISCDSSNAFGIPVRRKTYIEERAVHISNGANSTAFTVKAETAPGPETVLGPLPCIGKGDHWDN